MAEFDINTPARRASFLAQVGHESGQLRYVKELARGLAYEGRADLRIATLAPVCGSTGLRTDHRQCSDTPVS